MSAGGHGACPDMALAQETTIDSDAYQDTIIYGNNNGDTKTPNDDANGNKITVTAGQSVLYMVVITTIIQTNLPITIL